MTKRHSALRRSREVAGSRENCQSDGHWPTAPGRSVAIGVGTDGAIRCLTFSSPLVAGGRSCERPERHRQTKPLPADRPDVFEQQERVVARAAQHLHPGPPQQRQRFPSGVTRAPASAPPQPQVPIGRLATGTKRAPSQTSTFAVSVRAVCIRVIIDTIALRGGQSRRCFKPSRCLRGLPVLLRIGGRIGQSDYRLLAAGLRKTALLVSLATTMQPERVTARRRRLPVFAAVSALAFRPT
jgi:hypothetical protein